MSDKNLSEREIKNPNLRERKKTTLRWSSLFWASFLLGQPGVQLLLVLRCCSLSFLKFACKLCSLSTNLSGMGISTNLTFIKKVVTRTKRGKVSDTSEASQPRHDHWIQGYSLPFYNQFYERCKIWLAVKKGRPRRNDLFSHTHTHITRHAF